MLRMFTAVAMLLALATAGEAQTRTVEVGGGKIEVSLPRGEPQEFQDNLLDWTGRAAKAVSTYYGRFPLNKLSLEISADDRDGVHHGVTYPDGGGRIVISVGRHTSKADLENDWMLTHEMIHLAFPSMPRRQHWIEEGLSVYVEPIARVQTGQLSVEEMWFETLRDMHQGEPQSGDEGLDHTHTWGRTYWGGALFALMADVRIREQTRNKKGLQDALRAILEAGGTISEDWDLDRTASIGDRATGTHVLAELHSEMGAKPMPVDLEALWKRLGVRLEGKSVVFDANAPDAAIREAITRSPK